MNSQRDPIQAGSKQFSLTKNITTEDRNMLGLWSNNVKNKKKKTKKLEDKMLSVSTHRDCYAEQQIKRIQLLLRYVKRVFSGSAFFSVICTELIMENTCLAVLANNFNHKQKQKS